jgi:hypothetical protein
MGLAGGTVRLAPAREINGLPSIPYALRAGNSRCTATYFPNLDWESVLQKGISNSTRFAAAHDGQEERGQLIDKIAGKH